MMDDLRNENCFDQQRQRKGFKIAYLISKNDNFARPARFTRTARAFYDLVHFFFVLCKTARTAWNDQIYGLSNPNPNVGGKINVY